MADEVDRANDVAEAERAALLALQLARANRHAAPRLAADGTRLCTGCGEPIALARLAALPRATACTPCAADAEHQQRNTRGHAWQP